MAQAAAIVLADGQTTPVNTTFTPERVTPELSTFVDRLSGVAARFRRLSIRFLPSQAKTKTSFTVACPVWGTLPSGAGGVIYTLRARVELELPDGSTDGERKDLYAFLYNGLNATLIKGSMRDLDPLY